MKAEDLVKGQYYNFVEKSKKLKYIGYNQNEGLWFVHQFENEPGNIWAEIRDDQLDLIEPIKVYSVSHGKIEEYELVKETPCFYKVNTEFGVQNFSKNGISLRYNYGSRTTVTLDILEAAKAAQDQINKITEYIEGRKEQLAKAEEGLNEFLVKHSAEECECESLGSQCESCDSYQQES